MNLNKLLKNRIVRNAGWIIGGRLTNRILAFLVGILTARYLGPANYGLISYATTYTTFSIPYSHWESVPLSSRILSIIPSRKVKLWAQR